MLAYVALGSNLDSERGDPAATLRAALEQLAAHPGIELKRASRPWRSAPWGEDIPLGQGPYANAVAELETELSPEELLRACQDIERRFGRRRGAPGAARTLDLDLLVVGEERRESAALTLPHPRLHRRRFVLVPLAELAPDLRIPGVPGSVAELLAALHDPLAVEPWPAGAGWSVPA